jgi:sec-independent protein translocase protein TatB
VFGINPGEFAVLLLVILIVVGPERLPGYAQQLGKMVREGRKMAMGLREQVRGELGPEFDDVDWTKLDPRQYDPRRIIREALTDTLEDDEPAAKPVSSGGPTAAAAGAGAAGAVAGAASSRPASAASPAAAAAVGQPAAGADAGGASTPASSDASSGATAADAPAGDSAAPAEDGATPAVPQARTSSGAPIDLEAT